MRNGFRIFDSDTHVLPCAEVFIRNTMRSDCG